MTRTYDLYYDEDEAQPFCVALSGVQGYGCAVAHNITDNGFGITGQETDDELQEMAEYNADAWQPGEDDLELTKGQRIAGSLVMLRWLRDNA